MGNAVLVLGKSGTGKSRSLISLDPAATFLINVNGKDLPFPGGKSKYVKINGNPKGNMIAADDHDVIFKTINYVDKERKDVTVGVIDDFQYVMANEFMRRSKERGYDKFTEIADHAWGIIRACNQCRDNLTWFVLTHSDEDADGITKCKTIGKMLDEKICLEGMFTVVLNTAVTHLDGKTEYRFETQNNGRSVAKSPEGMFAEFKIPNDLKLVADAINAYNNGGK